MITATDAPLLPIFVWEPGILTGARSSANRNWFLRESLAELAASLRARGSTLVELQGPAHRAIPALIRLLRHRFGGEAPIDLFVTRDRR